MHHRLTKPQKLIYDMEKYAGGSVAAVCGSIIIKGKKEISEIRTAVNEIYRLNDALRIRIAETDGSPKQYLTEYTEQAINVLRFKDKVEFDLYAEKYAKEPMRFYDSLSDIQVVLLEDGYGILIKLHHIISDAWTLTLVGSQFNMLLSGKVPEAYSYLDYISEEERYLNSKRYLKDRDYYINQFKKCDEVTYISDKQVKSYKASRKTFIVSRDKTARIIQYAEANNTSVYMLLMTAFGIYINRIKMNQEKFYVGTAILNRSGLKDQNTMGMFINNVPLLFELDNEASFTKNLENITTVAVGVFRHQKFNYGDIIQTLRKSFDFSGNLYDVTLSYQNARITDAENSFETTWYSCGMQTESLQIHIDDRDGEGILKIHYDYQIEKFTENEIEGIHEHLFNLLFDAIDHDKKIININILSDNEKNTLLNDFNNTRAEYPKDKCVHQLFEEQVLKTPDEISVIACDKTFTYDELNKLANRIANALIDKGIRMGDIVAFAMPRNSYLVPVIFGILKSGAAYMPIDTDLPQERIDYMIADSNSKFYITASNLHEYISKNESNPNIYVTSNSYCYCIYTSGTTGNPKGMMIRHRNLVNFCSVNQNNRQCCMIKYGTRLISTFKYCFDAFCIDYALFLLNGKSLVLTSDEEMSNAEKLAELIQKYDVDVIYTTPSMFKVYCKNKKYVSAIKQVKITMLAAENFTSDLYEYLSKHTGAKIFNGYGPTETTIGVSIAEIKSTDITIGRPIANTKIYILDKYNNIMPIGQTGELCIAGDGVGVGYINRPELTAEKFVDNPFDEGKMYKTGDLAYWREDGNIAYVGRNDFQVKIRGLRIELGEIENAICSVDGISQAVVVVRKDESGRQFICAFYIEKTEVEIAEIKKVISDRLPKYMMPHIFTVISEMPLTPSGKVNRIALPEVDLNNINNNIEYVKPRTKLQNEIAKIMENVLNYSPIGLKNNFFDLGGDSLTAIEFVSKAYSEGIYFNVQTIFDCATVEELCEHIKNSDKHHISFSDMDFTKTNDVLLNNIQEDLFVPQKNDVGNVLLAGATGYLGMHILADFLDNDTGIVYCLVRGANNRDSKDRFSKLLEFYFDRKYADNDRIVVLCADLSQEKFGLSDGIYEKLLNCADTVINAAASVKHYGSYEYFYETNVGTVKNLIDFCKHADAKLIHISTTSVAGSDLVNKNDVKSKKHFYECNLYIGQKLDNVYMRSKFEAEKLVLDEIYNGLQANIMRMGNLTSRYSDARFQKNYASNAFLNRLKAIIALGIFPDYLMELPIEFTPIDDAARAVMTIARNFSDEKTVFHIKNDKIIYMTRLIEYLRQCGVYIKIVSGQAFAEALKKVANQSEAEHIFETFITNVDKNGKLDYENNIQLENRFTVEHLRRIGFEWSDIGFEYIKKYVDYFKEIGYFDI